MATATDRRKIIDEWFKEFSEDEDQISICIDVIDDGYLQLSCGTGFIIFSFNVDGAVGQLVEISSNGSDKFVDELAARCNNAFKLDAKQGDMSTLSANVQHIDLMGVLLKFSEISKDMAAHSNRFVSSDRSCLQSDHVALTRIESSSSISPVNLNSEFQNSHYECILQHVSHESITFVMNAVVFRAVANSAFKCCHVYISLIR